jgi:hypothetical protein
MFMFIWVKTGQKEEGEETGQQQRVTRKHGFLLKESGCCINNKVRES